MSSGLQFDPEQSRGLELQYKRPQMVQRRARALALADPRRGEKAIDIGCGPGFLCADLAAGVTDSGEVLGIDQSDPMLGLARARCAEWKHVRIVQADATELPVDDAQLDLATSTQVLEYVDDVDRALGEIARSLRPGGRAMLLATDWRAVAWHSSDDDRMQRVLSAWEEHLAHPALPHTLGLRLERLGLHVTHVERHSVLERSLDDTGYSAMLTGAIAAFAAGRGGVDEGEAKAWAEDLEAIRARGEYHFSLGQYFFCAEKS